MKEKLHDSQPSDFLDASQILRTVKNSECFFFNFTNGVYTGETALSLEDLSLILKTISIKSIHFHNRCGEFQNWIKNTLGDTILANNIKKIPKNVQGERLRNKLLELITSRIFELNSLS
jgi:hypothetical protein